MKLLDFTSAPIQSSVITVGTFDGFHRGHQELIKTLVATARDKSLPSVVVTFPQSPRSTLSPTTFTGELLSYPHKLNLITQLGVDYCFELPLTREFFATSPQDFYQHLQQILHPQEVLVGPNHTFGANRDGTSITLQELGQQLGFLVTIPDLKIEGTLPISTTRVKELLNQGNIPEAYQLLGRPLWISGIVKYGKQLGRTLGYPTANIQPDFPVFSWRPGVYAVYVYLQGSRYKGSLSIGTNPTTDQDTTVKYEVYIHNFDRDIYGEPIAVELQSFLRPEETFDSLDILKRAIANDVEQTNILLS